MAHCNQIEFIRHHRLKINGRILIVGSREYGYDEFDIRRVLEELGFTDIKGIDITAGHGVDWVVDIIQTDASFLSEYHQQFDTIFCMEIFSHLYDPHTAAKHVASLLKPGGTLFLSESLVRKISKMPGDYWRFTFDGLRMLFPQVDFNQPDLFTAATRLKTPASEQFNGKIPEIGEGRHPEESALGFLMRRIARRWLNGSLFGVSRFYPETTVYAVGKKRA
jgi:SAM-dependent methyltransferase